MVDEIGKDNAEQITRQLVNEKDKTIFGIQVDPVLFYTLNPFVPRIKNIISHTGEPYIKSSVVSLALAAKVPEATAQKVGEVAGRAFTYVFPYIPNLIDLKKTASIHKKNKEWLDDEIKVIIDAHSNKGEGIIGNITNVFSGGYSNKMVDYAYGIISSDTTHNIKKDFLRMAPNLVNNAYSYAEEKIKSIDGESEGQVVTPNNEVDRYKKALKFLDIGKEVAGGLDTAADKLMERESPKSFISKSSLGMVLRLKEYMRQHEIDGSRTTSNSEISQVTNMVAATFQQFQKEQGNPAIPSHRMNELARQITDELVFGDMQPLSLIDLIGKENLLNEQKNGVVNSEKAKDVISAEIAIFSKGSTVNVNEFMGEQNHELEDIKSHLASENKDMRAIVTILYPQSVLVAAGLKPQEISELRDHLSNEVIASMFSVVIDDLAQKPKLELQDMGFSTEAINLVKRYKDRPEDISELIANEPSARKGLENIVRAGIGGQDNTYWQDLVAETHRRAEVLEEIEVSKQAEQEESAWRHQNRNARPNWGEQSSPSRRRREHSPMDYANREFVNDRHK